MQVTDSLIEATAIRRFGCARASVVQYRDGVPLDGERPLWFGLTILRGGEWEPIGRRRSREALLEMVEQRTCTLR
jgi:hypothetical protein